MIKHINMKKAYTSLFLLMLTVQTVLAQTLFSTKFETEDEFKAWTLLDANNDEKTWTFAEDATPSKVFYTYSSTNQANDWLISPAITSETDGYVVVEYNYYGSSYGEAMDVYYGSGNTIADMQNLGVSYTNIPNTMQGGYFIMKAKAKQQFNIGFHATTPADKWRLYLCSVNVRMTNNPVDLKVSEIISPVTGEELDKETVTIKIENTGMVDVNSFSVAFDIDGTNITTEQINQTLKKGESMEYTFTAKADLSIPRHIYKIKAYTIHPDDISASNDTAIAEIRHIAPATVPYKMGFETTEDDMSGLQFFNLNNDSGNWGIETGSFFMNMARTGFGCLGYNYDKNNNADDWAMLEPINVDAGYYVLKFWYAGDDNHPEKLAVYWGNEATPEGMTNKVVEYAPFARGNYEESINILYFDKPQKVCFGFYAFSDKDENWITIDDVSFDKIDGETLDLKIESIDNPFEFHRATNKQDVVAEIRNIGIQDAIANINISIDNIQVKSEPVEMKAQDFKTITFKDVLSELETGEHTITVEVECNKDQNTENNVLSKSFVVVGSPVKFWDFEDSALPEDFTFRVEDEGTVNPNAGEEFNEYGWGIFNVSGSMYGGHTLAGTTWLDGTDKADRWAVMPKIKVTGDNSYFVWDANSYNENYLESYQIKVSDGEDTSYDYSTAKEITLESIYPKTHGICLDKYTGKEIYVAIRLITKSGEALILDNIGFYGDVSTETSGIENITHNGSNSLIISGNILTVNGNNVNSISVIGTSGNVICSATGNSIDISALATGIYIANVNTTTGYATYKFVKK